MLRVSTSVINSLSLLLILSCASVQAAPLTIIYSGNLDGELEPCGCTVEGEFGGIKRRASVLDQLREQHPRPVLLSSGGLIIGKRVIDRIKSEYIFKGFAELDYDAVGMQWQDLSYGVEFATQFDLPWVLGNGAYKHIARALPITRKTDDSQVELRIFSWLDPEGSPMPLAHTDQPLVSSDPRPLVSSDPRPLVSEIKRADKLGFLTILTTSIPLAAVRQRFDLAAIDLLLVQSAYENFAEPRRIGKTLVLQPGSRGKHIARLDLETDRKGDIAHWRHKLISLSSSVPDAPRMSAWYDEYNARLEQEYQKQVEIRKQRETAGSVFSGQATCKGCHSKQHAAWMNSEHAGAYKRLEEVNKAYDPNCVACHVVGFNKPGGFLDKLITPHLRGVQCESCHGAGAAHVRSAGQQPVAYRQWSKEQMCAQCHVKNHSPSFSVQSYWPRIAH